MNAEQIQVIRDLLEYTRRLEQIVWNGDEAEDAIVILAESMVLQAETDLMADG